MMSEPGLPAVSQPPSMAPKEEAASSRFISVGTKLAGATIALMVTVTAFIYIQFSQYERESLLRSKEMAATAVTRLFADSCAAPIVFADTTALNDALATLGRNEDIVYAAVWGLDPAGKVGDRLAELSHGPPVDLKTVGAEVALQREADRVVLVAPVRDPDTKLVGAAVAAFSLGRENAAISGVQKRTLLVSALVAAGITALLLIIARLAIVRPLSKLVSAANKIGRGKTSEIDVRSNDEIGQLASAFRNMAKAIQNREERINARNRDMRLVLDNVEQGFVTLQQDGRMSEERSRVVAEWFGMPEPGMSFGDLLRRADNKVGEWFDVGWSALQDDLLPVEVYLRQLPRLVHKGERVFELAFRPILENGKLSKVLAVISDATARIERERAEAAQRETMTIFQHILSDRIAFEVFFEEIGGLIQTIERSDDSSLTALKRNVHTLKGNTAIFGIESIAAFCHALEDKIEQSGEITSEQKQELRTLWNRIAKMRAQFSREGGIVVEPEEYRSLLEQLRSRAAYEVLLATVTSWQLEPAAKRLALLGEQIGHIARGLGKGEVQLRLGPTKLRLPSKKWAPFWAAFAHVLRNAADHGLEMPEERTAAGKPANATISLSLEREGREVVLAVEDDGRGIEWTIIAERARMLGLPHSTPAELEASLFVQGVSSRSEVTTTSGRGVGLAAVREVVTSLGGRITVTSEEGVGTRFCFYLPTSMLVDDSGGSVTSLAPSSSEERVRAVAPARI